MNTISRVDTNAKANTRGPPTSGWNYYKGLAKGFAKIVDSRESTYRLALDLTAFDIPTLSAEAFRGIWRFLEAGWEAGIGTLMVFAAPKITTWVADFVCKFILPKEEQAHAKQYLRFHMSELSSTKDMQKAVERIKDQEPKDQERIAKIYDELGNKKQHDRYINSANKIREFCNNFKPNEEIREKIYKLKKAVILGESLIEGGVWGGFGLSLRFFRKYILRQDRFTGTMGYLSDEQSKGLGEGGELTLTQKILGGAVIFLSPLLNTILLNSTKDKKVVEKSKFLSTVDEHLDMTHGVFPKLGLLFTYTSVPKWMSLFITSQGWYERLERIFKFLTIIPSWWLGHRVTNGIIAKAFDKKLSEKYNIKSGILVEPEYLKPAKTEGLSFMDKLKYWCPEPARIHHVLDRVEGEKLSKEKKEELHKEAEHMHAITLYTGFALHSFLVWCVTMLVNWTTKLRVKHDMGQ